MSKKLISVLLVLVLVLTVFVGCQKTEAEPTPDVQENNDAEVVEDEEPEEPTETEEVLTDEEKLVKELVEATTQDLYPELEITAGVLERKAILPGHPFNVHVTIANNGDKDIAYQHGSGSAVIPSAMHSFVHGLQIVPPAEHLGPMTMDMQTNILKAGETAEFVITVMAMEPVEDFLALALEYQKETEGYIGEATVEEIKAIDDSVVEAPAGEYEGEVYLFYTVLDGEEVDVMGEPTGYAVSNFKVGVQG